MKHSAVVVAAAVILGGCGGGGDGGGSSQTPTPPPVTSASPGGIWEGSLGSGELVLGLVTESGEFHFLTDDGTQYFGTVATNGTSASAQFTGYTAGGFIFQDGSTRGTGSLSGTVQARSSFNATSSFKTSAGNSNSNSISLTYSALYDRDSSLATLAGNFRDIVTGTILNINSSGQAFAQNAATGCVLNGSASIINPQFNAYRVQYAYSSCQGADAFLNGTTFNGLATLDNTVTPEELIVGAQALIGSTGVSVVEVLDRT